MSNNFIKHTLQRQTLSLITKTANFVMKKIVKLVVQMTK